MRGTTSMMSLLSGFRPNDTRERVPINIRPEVRQRLRDLLMEPEFRGVGYSSFIERAVEAAETEMMNRRSGRQPS